MNFKVNISKIASFDDAVIEIAERNGVDKPNLIEINSDDAPILKIFVSDTFIARLPKQDIRQLKSFT